MGIDGPLIRTTHQGCSVPATLHPVALFVHLSAYSVVVSLS